MTAVDLEPLWPAAAPPRVNNLMDGYSVPAVGSAPALMLPHLPIGESMNHSTPSFPTVPKKKSGAPHDVFVEVLEDAGWVVERRAQVFASGPNPTRLDIRRAQDWRQFLIYAWNITLEGKGRVGNNYRTQSTRAHDGALICEPDRSTVGIGWDEDRQVLSAYDGWTKRETGFSTSVHIKRETLDTAAANGWAEEGPPWDARAAFRPEKIGRFLAWIGQMGARREAALRPLEFKQLDKDTAEIVGQILGGQPTGWLRQKDRIVVVDSGRRLADDRLWRIEHLAPIRTKTPGGRQRTWVQFTCRRVGAIHDPSVVELVA